MGTPTSLLGRIAELARAGRMHTILRDVPQCRLADLGEDMLARVSGTVQRLDSMLEAPLSQRACVYYSVTVERVSRPRELTVHPLASEESCVPFVLVDESAHVLIDPIEAVFLVGFDRVHKLDAMSDIGPRERQLFARHNLPMDDRGWRIYVRESIIEIGRAVTVVGSSAREPDLTLQPDQPYRGEAATQLRLSGSPRIPLIVTNLWAPLTYWP